MDVNPTVDAAPMYETSVTILFDENALYVRIRAIDPEPQLIRAPLVRHDDITSSHDFVAVYIDAPIGPGL